MTKKKQSAEAAVREIRRRTRRKFSPEEKIRIVLEGLRGGLNWYWNENELGSACPARWIAEQTRRIRKRFEILERRKAAYTPEELAILLEIARDRFPILFEMWALDVATGLRFGELLGLEWAEIDWLQGTVFPRFQIDDRGKPVLPKSERNLERDGPVRLAPEALEILKARRLVRTSDRWVFATKNGTPYRPRNVQRWIEEVRKKAAPRGVPLAKTSHSTRHTFASGAIAASWDWESVRAALSHHSAAFTAKVYVHGPAGSTRSTGRRHRSEWSWIGHSGQRTPSRVSTPSLLTCYLS
jgi:integrase